MRRKMIQVRKIAVSEKEDKIVKRFPSEIKNNSLKSFPLWPWPFSIPHSVFTI
jgi:hypothetical protein